MLLPEPISEFKYDGGEKISIQEISQNINQAVRAVDLNGIATKLNDIIRVVNEMNNITYIPTPTLISCISGITVNGTEVAIQNGIANITIPDYKDKLDGIEAGAQANKIESISINNTIFPADENKNVDLDMLDETIAGSVIDYELKNNTFTTCSDEVSNLKLKINTDICAMFQFTTAPSGTFTGGTIDIISTDGIYYTNNQISFDYSTTYLVSVDHNVILWNEIEPYIPADNEQNNGD